MFQMYNYLLYVFLLLILFSQNATSLQPDKFEKPIISRLINKLNQGTHRCTFLAISNDNQYLIILYTHTLSQDASLIFISIPSGEITHAADISGGGGNNPIPGCTISPLGDRVAYAGRDGIHCLPVPSQRPKLPANRFMAYSKDVRYKYIPIWFDRTGENLYCNIANDGSCTIESLDLDSYKRKQVFSHDTPNDCRIDYLYNSTTSDMLILSIRNNRDHKSWVEIWNYDAKKYKCKMATDAPATSIALSPDGKIAAVGFETGGVSWYETATGKKLHSIDSLGLFRISDISFHPKGRYLACATYDGNGTNNLYIIDTKTYKIIREQSASKDGVIAARFSPDGNYLATFSSASQFSIWNTSCYDK